jgi:hypothetical protein
VPIRAFLIVISPRLTHYLRFPPASSSGIAVLELGGRASLPALLERLRSLLATLELYPLTGRLWIIEPGRVRMHLPSGDEDA